MERRFIGIDLHKKSFTMAIKSQNDSKKFHMKTMLFTNEGIEELKSLLQPEDYVAIEASTPSFYFYDKIAPVVKKCVVVNPRKFKVVSESTSKTDKKDAKLLAKYLSYEDLLPEVFVPDENIRKLRTLFAMYDLTKKQISQARNKIASLLLQYGVSLEQTFLFKKTNRNAIFNISLDSDIKDLLKLLYDKFDYLEEEKEKITFRIFDYGKKLYEKEIDILTSISGISILIALSLIADIAGIKRFDNSRKLCSYLGVVPKVDNSGNTTRHGSIKRDSRNGSRTLLTQVIQHLYNNSEHLKSFYDRKRKGKGAGKVRVAIMRKVITMIYHMLSKEEYSYYRNEKSQNRKFRDRNRFLEKHREKYTKVA